MKLKTLIHDNLCYVLLALAAVFAMVSLFVKTSTIDTSNVASHVSFWTQSRMDRLDRYAESLLDEPSSNEDWKELRSLPEDMVLYRYVADTLHSWYNLFSVMNDDISPKFLYQRMSVSRMPLSSPLSSASETPVYMNLDSRWYIVKMLSRGNVRVVEGLLIKDNEQENIANGRNGINPMIHIHGKYNVDVLGQDEGSPVFLDGQPIFKIVIAPGVTLSSSIVTSYWFRWAALILLISSIVIFLTVHRSVCNCAIAVALIMAFTFLARSWGIQLMEFNRFFNPVLYAHDTLLNSFGTLLIFNMAIFLCIFCLYVCRNEICAALRDRAWPSGLYIAGSAIFIGLLLLYIFFTFCSIIRNSAIGVELYRFNTLSWYTLYAYISYALLFTGVLLLVEIVLGIYSNPQRKLSILTHRWVLVYSFCVAIVLGATTASEGFTKEQSRVMVWSNRLAVDRDLSVELILRGSETDIEQDPVLQMLANLSGSEGLLQHRLMEMYFMRLGHQYDVTVEVGSGNDRALLEKVAALVSGGTAIGPDSHFIYNYNPASASFYTGIFNYYDKESGLKLLLIGITPRSLDMADNGESLGSVNLPHLYSYAKYTEGRLVSFSGNYAYSTVASDLFRSSDSGRKTFTRSGYRHFVNKINPDETIVISRRKMGLTAYLVSVTFLVLLLFIVSMPFHIRRKKDDLGPNFFSTRMRQLVVSSLVFMLVLVALVSVVFIYQRNQRNQDNAMSRRVSAIQLLLDGECRQMESADAMLEDRFLDKLQDIGRNTRSEIILYSTDGKAFMGSSPDAMEELSSVRMNPVAYRNIMFSHQRYFINDEPDGDGHIKVLYAPVMGAGGDIIAIASTAYQSMDVDFMVEVIFHASAIISLFFIILIIAVLFSSSTTESIFRPLVAISQKMSGMDVSTMEQIDYDGDDEISSLVSAYNGMVEDLRESTARLAASERDKAWSEMARQVAHEIKNPLTPIKLEIQRLVRLKQKQDPVWEERFDAVSKVILDQIDILSQTANEFGNFAKLYSEEPVEFDVDKVLRDQMLLFSDSGAEITYLGIPDAMVFGPKPQLTRVFVNLVTNAIQAVAAVPEPHIVVSLRRGVAHDTLDVDIEDNGPGVSPENLDKLFTPNFTTKSSGTGLGLAISRNIVEKCGGSIVYNRSFKLGGACFTVTLPVGNTIES